VQIQYLEISCPSGLLCKARSRVVSDLSVAIDGISFDQSHYTSSAQSRVQDDCSFKQQLNLVPNADTGWVLPEGLAEDLAAEVPTSLLGSGSTKFHCSTARTWQGSQTTQQPWALLISLNHERQYNSIGAASLYHPSISIVLLVHQREA